MTDAASDEYKDVLSALRRTEIPVPAGLEGPVASALAEPDGPERVNGIEAVLSRDADEAWSLAMAFLADEDAAWEAVVAGFIRLGRGDCVAISQADSMRTQAESALEVGRLLAKGGHQPEVCGAGLPLEVRLGILVQAGLRPSGIHLEDTPDLSTALLEAYPRPGHERGDELCRLLARGLLGTLDPEQAATLETLRREHPTSATLIHERYAEVAEVPLLVLPRVDELTACVLEQLTLDSEHTARVGAVRLRVTVTCSFCHDGLGREDAVFCSGCLAPHHEECFRMHGRCSAPGCAQTQVVRPGKPVKPLIPAPQRRRRFWPLLLAMGIGAGGVAAWNEATQVLPPELSSAPSPRAESTPPPPETPPSSLDPELLRKAEARAAKAEARRAALRAENEVIEKILEERSLTCNFEGTAFDESIDFLRDITQLNYVISSAAQDVIHSESVTVSLRLRDVSLKNGLNLILASNESLSYRIERGVIKIGTSDDMREELLLEVYDVGEILGGETKDRGGVWVDPDMLIQLLERCLSETEEEGSIEITGTTLIVRKARSVHRKTHKLLAYLRGTTRGQPQVSEDPAWIKELDSKLEKTMTLDFPQSPLSEVVAALQDATGANMVVSSRVDAEEATVSVQLRDVSARDALRVILEQLGLAMTFRNETLMITQPEEARGALFLRILDTADIEAWLEPDALQSIVVNAVGEDNWDDPAWIECHHQQLILNQSSTLHEAVDDVLAKLRISRARNLKGASGE